MTRSSSSPPLVLASPVPTLSSPRSSRAKFKRLNPTYKWTPGWFLSSRRAATDFTGVPTSANPRVDLARENRTTPSFHPATGPSAAPNLVPSLNGDPSNPVLRLIVSSETSWFLFPDSERRPLSIPRPRVIRELPGESRESRGPVITFLKEPVNAEAPCVAGFPSFPHLARYRG